MITYGLCGRTLRHSYSKIIHEYLGNSGYKLLSLEKDELYELFESKGFKALNVTIPYKQDALMLCDVVSDEAKAIGSVNTVVNKNGKLYGYNTDIDGMRLLAKKAGISLSGKKVLVLGSGGTSLTARALAKSEGAKEILVVSRSGEVNYDNVYDESDAEIIINTTPVGMFPNNGKAAVDLSRFPKLTGVLDAVYNPLKTELILEAESLGIPAAGGLFMLVAQAKRAEELFFDKVIADEENERVYRTLMQSFRNIVLIGMPGCGKTTVGKALAKKLGREFVDIDALIEKNAKKSIPEIFANDGEEVFRRFETEAAIEAGKMTGKIIACGGGIVTRERNYRPLKQNALIVRLVRSLDRLAMDGRPLSSSRERLTEMQKEREPLYLRFADVSFENNTTIEDLTEKILEEFNK
ncbi:MAG: AAA family ATPase [Christensenellaceae bacterium]|nr:AAA family ATPase [Christensenellaceae bacterium]